MSCKIEVLIKTFNLDTKHDYFWRLPLMTPVKGWVLTGVLTGGEKDLFK